MPFASSLCPGGKQEIPVGTLERSMILLASPINEHPSIMSEPPLKSHNEWGPGNL